MSTTFSDSQASQAVSSTSTTVAVKKSGRLLIVGSGMAAYGLCAGLVRNGLNDKLAITVIGEEPRPAYDRVNASKIFSDRPVDQLLLAPREWYDEHHVCLQTRCRVERIDRDACCVVDTEGRVEPYDQLVLATGSYAWVPPIPGAQNRGVFVYRTIDDLLGIRDYVSTHHARTAAVIGGGLLGLEAAKVFMDLGLQTSVLEVAPGLMPRQLDSRAASILRQRVESMGIAVHLVRRTERIDSTEGGRLTIHFQNASPLSVDVLIIAAGVRPRDELGRSAGLKLGSRGGIAIDSRLQTSDPKIFAIGECAAFNNHIYGLVAPCYRMADVLADRLSGLDTEFLGADESAELKLLGVPVVALGRPIGELSAGVVLKHEDSRGYRKIILEQGRVTGAAGVGDWDEIRLLRHAISKHQRVWPHQRNRFARTGQIWSGSATLPIHQWPPEATVCSCHGVTRATLSAAVASGATTPEALAATTGASTACGSCRSLVCELAGVPPHQELAPVPKVMLILSLVTVIAAIGIVVAPPIPFADSVQSQWRAIDAFWRDGVIKQISGFTLLGLMCIALLFSLRKRTQLLNLGSYLSWRTMHVVLGTTVVLGLIVHTGLRMGANLNFALSATFLALSLLGGIAGVLSSIETRVTGSTAMRVRSMRPLFTMMHIWLFVPLPVLILVHIVSVYWY